jgi:S-adenosylmethionine synthetase
MIVPNGSFLFTSESVTEGHPDKVADQISDAILDAHLAQNPEARVACETLVAGNRAILAGEITSNAQVDHEQVIRDLIRRIGYDRPEDVFAADTVEVKSLIRPQAREISDEVDIGGAGDQGIMFGYACDETPELMPLPIMLAHQLAKRLADARHDGLIPWLRPDGKSQVTVEYQDGIPVRVAAVVVSCQHEDGVPLRQIRETVRAHVVEAAIEDQLRDADTQVLINPSGSFVHGGPGTDSGLTGRKIIVDTYGGAAPHGGGAFSGKDATKVDRSAAYMARYIARSLVAAGHARRILVQLSYAIAVPEPVSVDVMELDSDRATREELRDLILDSFPLTPKGMIEHLGLQRPIFLPTAAYGHFGRTGEAFSWEQNHFENDSPSAETNEGPWR